jgi:hypothetical protein
VSKISVNFKREWKYFSVEELHSRMGMEYVERYGAVKVEGEFMEVLVRFREYLGKPMVINCYGMRNRGWRHWLEHVEIYKKLGKRVTRYSSHLDGRACDFHCKEVDVQTLKEKVLAFNERAVKGFTELGVYGTFLHVGLRQSDNFTIWRGK